jgi:hypothetical protein
MVAVATLSGPHPRSRSSKRVPVPVALMGPQTAPTKQPSTPAPESRGAGWDLRGTCHHHPANTMRTSAHAERTQTLAHPCRARATPTRTGPGTSVHHGGDSRVASATPQASPAAAQSAGYLLERSTIGFVADWYFRVGSYR